METTSWYHQKKKKVFCINGKSIFYNLSFIPLFPLPPAERKVLNASVIECFSFISFSHVLL